MNNIRLLNILYVLHALNIGWGVIHVLFLQAKGLSYTQIGILLGVLVAVITVLEIPTGNFSDIYGRKKSLYVAFASFSIAGIIYSLSSTFWGLLLGISVIGCGIAFWSGTPSSLLYETVKNDSKKRNYQDLLAKNHFLFIVLGVATNLAIPYLFSWNTNAPFILSALFGSAGLLVISKLKEQPYKEQTHSFKHIIVQATKTIRHKKYLQWLLLFSSVWGVSIMIFGDMVNQPLVEQQFTINIYGPIFAAATLVQAGLVYYFKSIFKRQKYLLLVLVWTACLIGMLSQNLIVFTILMGIAWTVGSAKYILIENDLQYLVTKDSQRASVSSIRSMIESIVFLLTIPLTGLYLEYFSLESAVIMLATSSLVLGVLLLGFKNKYT